MSLVRLVYDEDVELVQARIPGQLPQEDALGEEQNLGERGSRDG